MSVPTTVACSQVLPIVEEVFSPVIININSTWYLVFNKPESRCTSLGRIRSVLPNVKEEDQKRERRKKIEEREEKEETKEKKEVDEDG